jgi:hypothetical protein
MIHPAAFVSSCRIAKPRRVFLETTLMRRSTLLLFLLLFCRPSVAQERIDPRHPDAVEFPEAGRMAGTIDSTTWTGKGIGEQFGFKIHPLDDVDHDGLNDWLLAHVRIDSIQVFQGIHLPPVEFLLFKGGRGGVPSVETGVRIGPTELFGQTDFLAAGDFDADGHRDIVLQSWSYGDTNYGNDGTWPLAYMIVYWGNDSGRYTNDDTTRLISPKQTWLATGRGASGDVSGDGIDDLLLYIAGGRAYDSMQSVRVPRMHLFIGGINTRWGRQSVTARPIMKWWSHYQNATAPELQILDHDLDGTLDIVLLEQVFNTQTSSTAITILYGRRGRELPDTLDVERIEMDSANAKTVRLIDVTGDGAREIVTTCGEERTFKIFAGHKGQRLLEQYGSRNDGPFSGMGWWSRPWQTILQPNALHDGWRVIEQMALPNLGDANRDGIADIWTYSAPFLLCYTTREYPDQWADGFIRIDNLYEGANLGDIDGSGKNTIALHYDQKPRDPKRPDPGGIVFIRQNASMPTEYNGNEVRLPHSLTAVHETAGSGVRLLIRADARSGVSTLVLLNGEPGTEYPVEVVDPLGRTLAHYTLSRANGYAWLDLPRGLYFISLETGAGRIMHSVLVD